MEFEKIEKFVKESFGEKSFKHFERTVFWLKQLDPKADDSLLIAGLMHDIERAFRKSETEELVKRVGYDHPEFLKIHQTEGSEIAKEFLLKEGVDPITAKEVEESIKRHETGGTPKSDTLMEADTISFFETNAKSFIDRVKNGSLPKEKAKDKFDFMIKRLKSDKARELCEPLYRQSLMSLEEI